jgi:hypothetical protein
MKRSIRRPYKSGHGLGCEWDVVMKIKTIFPTLVAASAFLGTAALADQIQFTTLPQPVQTTVIRETHIPGPTAVTRVVQDPNGVYAVTVHADTGDRVVYVNSSGEIVQAPGNTTTTTTVQQPATQSEQTTVTYDKVQKSPSRYELLEKKGKKEVYLDHQTGQKVTVKRESD